MRHKTSQNKKKLKISKYLLGLSIFSLLTVNAYSADWAILDGDAKQKTMVEMDMASIQQFAHVSKAWVRISYPKAQIVTLFKQPLQLPTNTSKPNKTYAKQHEYLKTAPDESLKTYQSVVYRVLLDCLQARYVYAHSMVYELPQGFGQLLGVNKMSERQAMQEMRDIAPESIASIVFHYGCDRSKMGNFR